MKIIEHLHLHKNQFLIAYKRSQLHKGNYHAHQGMEFLYIHSGSGYFMLDHRMFELKSGMLIYFQPFQFHRVKVDDSVDYIRSYIVFEPSLFEPYLSAFQLLRHFFHHIWKEELTNQVVYDLKEDHPMIQMLHKLDQRKKQQKHELMEEGILYILSLLSWLRYQWENHEPVQGHSVRSLDHIEKIMAWLDEHYLEPFSMKPLSEHVHLSPKHISSIFRKKTGITITEFLTSKRINHACFLLKTTNQSISDIAYESGFSNFSYFSQLFKKKVGVTPRHFRRNYLDMLGRDNDG